MAHKDLTLEQKIHIQEAVDKKIKEMSKDLDSPSDKDIKILKESSSNSYSSDNKKIIKALKKD